MERPPLRPGDPLLYIESLPYWETRGYVPIVLRNYWIYEEEAGKPGPSRAALAQGMWPRFPGMAGANAVRLRADETRLAYTTE
jgi:soluble lytic murein transglycosylase